jgi:hypothetical protein
MLSSRLNLMTLEIRMLLLKVRLFKAKRKQLVVTVDSNCISKI